MGQHDIFVYDDDTRQLHLRTRAMLTEDALALLADDTDVDPEVKRHAAAAEVRGFAEREDLLQAIEARRAADWVIGLLDLQHADGSMRGGRILRTIRRH